MLDLGNHVAHSRLFQQDLELEDREGLPAVKLIPLNDGNHQHFAMMADAEPRAPHNLEEANPIELTTSRSPKRVTFGKSRTELGSGFMLFNVAVFAILAWKTSLEEQIESEVLKCSVRRTVAIPTVTGEQAEFRDQWRRLNPTDPDTAGYLDGLWKGCTYFYRDYARVHEERKAGPAEDDVGMFAAFDGEKPVTLNQGQKRQLQEGSESIGRQDTTMWAELKGVPAYRRTSRVLPRGGRSFIMEIFAGAAAIDLQTPGWDIRDPAARHRLSSRIEAEDPYLLAIAPVTLPWNQWSTSDLWAAGGQAREIV